MDKPLCRLCGHRHYKHEEHVFPEEEARPFVREASKKTLARADWSDCPFCAERRRKKAEAMKRWRAKKKEER